MRIPSTDEVTLELHDLGGDGPALLIAHATGFCAGAYRPLADLLAADFHVWALDFRAHGDSTGPADGDLTWRGMADDVLAVVAEIGDGPLPAFGHSMGGACLLAAELRRPGTLSAAFVYEPIVMPEAYASMTADNPLAAAARRRRASFPTRAEALSRYASRPPLGSFRADALHAYVETGFREEADGTVSLKCSPESEARTFEARQKPTVEEMPAVATPTVVACGASEPGPGPAGFAPAIAEALPHGRLHRYDHLDHFGPFQDPVTLARDVRAALIAT